MDTVRHENGIHNINISLKDIEPCQAKWDISNTLYIWHCFLKKSIFSPWKVIENSKGQGVLETKNLNAKYEAKLGFPELGEERGLQNKKPSVCVCVWVGGGGVWIFSGTAHSYTKPYKIINFIPVDPRQSVRMGRKNHRQNIGTGKNLIGDTSSFELFKIRV